MPDIFHNFLIKASPDKVCRAMYLRILERYVEYGEKCPYEDRLNV